MFTRELHMIESFKAWDAIFYDYYQSNQDTLLLVDAIALSMIVYVKNDCNIFMILLVLKEEENSPCYQRFLKYVNITDLPGLI